MKALFHNRVIMPTIVAALAAAVPAYGQTVPVPTAQTAAGGAPNDNAPQADIIVTAQKREQNIQKVPISMTVIGGAEVSAYHQTDIHSLQNSIPNLYVERLNFADTIYLRGFGTGPANFAFDSSVSLYVDGIYSGRPQQFSSPFFDVDRIEVLRGPQGALFGKNTAAGAVSIVTANPTRTFKAGVTAAYNFDLDGKEVSGYVSGPLSDTLSARISGRYLDNDGYVRNSVSGQDNPRRQEKIGRIALRYEPMQGVDLTAKLQYAETDTKGENQVMASLTDAKAVNGDQANDPNPFGFADAAHFKGWNGSFTGDVPISDHTLTLVSGFASFEANRANSYSDDVPAIFLNRIDERFSQYSSEVRLTSPADRPLTYIVGGYIDFSHYYVGQPFNFNLLGGALAGATTADFHQDSETYSAFGQGIYSIADALRLIGSLRYTHVDKRGRYQSSSTGFPLTGPAFIESGSFGEDHFDPSATVQFDASRDIMFYATYARGSKSGGFVSNNINNPAPAALPPFSFRPEQSRSYEIGVKSQFFDRRVTVNLSLYDTKIKDLQTSVFDASVAGGGFVTQNAGSATSKGVEATLRWMPNNHFGLSFNGAYQDAKYDDFLGANCLATQPASVCNPTAAVGAPNSPQFNNLAGYDLTFASHWTGNVEGQFHLPIGDALKLNGSGRAAYRSRFFIADDQNPVYGVQQGYVKLDARLELAATNGPWAIAVVGKNLTDRKTFSFANAWPAPLTATPTALKYLDEPRTVQLEASLHF